jgi:hypothetical protein
MKDQLYRIITFERSGVTRWLIEFAAEGGRPKVSTTEAGAAEFGHDAALAFMQRLREMGVKAHLDPVLPPPETL